VFVAQAHSFSQQARLAITLAWVAGYTNILTILTCGHVTSHVSGTTSNLGRDVVEALRGAGSTWSLVTFGFFLLATFMLGAFLSGLATEVGRRRNWESVYVLPMAMEAVLLAGFAVGVEVQDPEVPAWTYVLTGLASAAMGLQNATITRISAGVVRTTHVTGVLTDLGAEAAQFAMAAWDAARKPSMGTLWELRRHVSVRRLALLASIMGSFAMGAGLGTLAFDTIPRHAMFPPVLFLLWIIAQDLARPIVEIESSDLVGDASLRLPPELAVYHLRRDRARAKAPHRLPDLVGWAERLPARIRLVVLDLTDVTMLDQDSASELVALVRRMNQTGRRLLLAGVDREQYAALSGAGGPLDPMAAFPDLEIAVAFGLSWLEHDRSGAGRH